MASQKGSRKLGTNKKACEVYKMLSKRSINKARRQERHRKRVEKKRAKLAARAAKAARERGGVGV